MRSKHEDIFAALAAPFFAGEVKTRSGTGKAFDYITARVAMNRLDNVLGADGWWDEYEPRENSVLCRLTIRLPDGSTLTKSDAGGYAGMADSGDDDKSGYSDAFKRACVKFGVARYLYADGVPGYVSEKTGLRGYSVPATKDEAMGGEPAPDQPPAHGPPAPRQPDRPRAQEPAHDRRPAPQNGNGGGGDRPAYNGPQRAPTSGKGLFAWSKEIEQNHDVGMLKYLTQWAKLNDFPGRMVDWDGDQTAKGYAEANRKLAALGFAAAQPAPAPPRATAPAATQVDRGDAYEEDDAGIPF